MSAKRLRTVGFEPPDPNKICFKMDPFRPISNSNSRNCHRSVHKREPNRAEARDEKKRLGSPKSAIYVPKIPERIPRCAKSLKTDAGTVRVMSQSGRVGPPKMDVGSYPISLSRTNRTLPYIIPSLLHAIIHSLLCASLALAVQYRVAPYTQCI